MESLEEYMKAQGYTMGEDADLWSGLGYAMFMLHGLGIINDDEWPIFVKRFGEKAVEFVTEVDDE